MHILKRRFPKRSTSRKGRKSRLRRVFSSEKDLTKSSSLENLKGFESGSMEVSEPKVSQTLSSNSLPGLTEINSFESVWTIRSDSSADEATPIHRDNSATTQVSFAVESSSSFEAELSLVLEETVEKLPASSDVNTSNATIVDEEEKGLEIDCSDSLVLPTPPSSTNAIFSGDLCEFSFTSDSTVKTESENTASPAPKAVEKPRCQDIFRQKVENTRSPVARMPAHCWESIDTEQLHVKFKPSFEGIEMTQSFQQLESNTEEPSWCTPSMSFETDKSMFQGWKIVLRQIVRLLTLFLLLGVYDNRLPIDKVGIPLSAIVTPALEDLLVQHVTDGPVVKKTFYNSHHTAMGVWLK